MIPVYITIIFVLMLILPTFLIICLKNRPKALKISALVLGIIYFTLLFIGTTFKVYIKNNNLVIYPDFTKNWFSLKFLLSDFSVTNILINLALLFPIGFIVYVFAKKHRFSKTILFSFLLSLFIEFYQFALPISRATELTDILFNTISGVISATYCSTLEKFGCFKKE